MEITAAVLPGVGLPLDVATLTLDEPGPAEVRVRLATSGVCASDAHTQDGRIPSPTPSVLGHEGAGVVESIGPGVTHVAIGDHVALSWLPNCARCRHCQRGRPVLCTTARPALLVAPRYARTGRTGLAEVSPSEMVLELAESTFHFPEHPVEDLRCLARLVEGCTYTRLEVNDLDTACDLITDLLEAADA